MGLKIDKEGGYMEASLSDLTEYIDEFIKKDLDEQVEFLVEEHVRIHVIKTAIEVFRQYTPATPKGIKMKVYRLGLADLCEMSIENCLDYGTNEWSKGKGVMKQVELAKVIFCWKNSDEDVDRESIISNGDFNICLN